MKKAIDIAIAETVFVVVLMLLVCCGSLLRIFFCGKKETPSQPGR